MKILAILFSFIFFIPFSRAQISDDLLKKGLNEIPIITVLELGSSRDQISQQNIKNLLMPPRKQMNAKSSAFYAIASALEFYVNLNSNFKINLSPEFIKFHLPSGKQNLPDALNFLKEEGTISAALLPYDAQKLTAAMYQAERYKIDSYLQLFKSDFRERHKIFAIKKALLRGNPVIATLSVNQDFAKLNYQNRYWDPHSGQNSNNTKTVLIVGYDEDDEVFEIMNFQGSEWGNRGCVLVDYEDLGNHVREGFVLVRID